MSFLFSIEEHKKDKHKYAMITGFEGNASNLALPAEIDGYVVEAIGNHAFSGRQDLITVQIPETVKTIYGFAFHNCRKLKKIALFDSIDDYYDGVCRQCDNLEEVEITVNNSWYEVIRNFLADNDNTVAKEIFNETKKLYNKRSSAVHGNKMKENIEDAVFDSASLLNRIVRHCAEVGYLPDVDNLLFN